VKKIKCPKSPNEYIIIPTFSTLNPDETRKIKILMKSNKVLFFLSDGIFYPKKKNFLEMRLKDVFDFEALKCQIEALNFSFSNASDFWRVKDKQSQNLLIQRLSFPVAFRQYDKLRNMTNIIYPQDVMKRDSKSPEKKRLEETQKNGENSIKKGNVFSFAPTEKNKQEIVIDATLNPYMGKQNNENERKMSKSADKEELLELRKKIKHYSDVLSEKEKNMEEINVDPDISIKKTLYIETVHSYTFFLIDFPIIYTF